LWLLLAGRLPHLLDLAQFPEQRRVAKARKPRLYPDELHARGAYAVRTNFFCPTARGTAPRNRSLAGTSPAMTSHAGRPRLLTS
jgi:hypothetical protein